MKRTLQLLLLLSLCTVLPSCFAYQARFTKAVAAADGKYKDPTGPWHGRWKSGHNGHEGPLWCIITETPDKPGSYDFRYRAGWGILQFGNYVHTVKTGKNADGDLTVKGKMDLPELVGEHSLDGTVSATAFNATYKSEKGDHGTMKLARPPARGAKPAPAAAKPPTVEKKAAPKPAKAAPKASLKKATPRKPASQPARRTRTGSRSKSRGLR